MDTFKGHEVYFFRYRNRIKRLVNGYKLAFIYGSCLIILLLVTKVPIDLANDNHLAAVTMVVLSPFLYYIFRKVKAYKNDIMLTFNRGVFSVNKVIFTVDDVERIEHSIVQEIIGHERVDCYEIVFKQAIGYHIHRMKRLKLSIEEFEDAKDIVDYLLKYGPTIKMYEKDEKTGRPVLN